MTKLKTGALRKALKSRLTTELKAQGIGPDSDRPDVPVYTDVTSTRAQIFVRIDSFSFQQGTTRAGRQDTYGFSAHVFAKETGSGDEIADVKDEASRVQSIVVDALDNWVPMSGSTEISHLRSASVPDEDPEYHHEISKFTVMIKGD